MTDLRILLRAARKAASVSLNALAAQSHFTKGHLSNVEAQRRAATPDLILAYEQILGVRFLAPGVELAYLLTGVADAPRPDYAGMADVIALEDTTVMLTALDLDRGGGLACEMAKGQLRWAVGLLGATMKDPIRERLSVAVATLANRTSFSMFDAGDSLSAARLSSLALRASDDTNSADLRAHILADIAERAIHDGQPAEALRTVDVPDAALAPVTRFVLHGVRARAHGAMGDTSATWREVAFTEQAHEQVDVEQLPDFSQPFAAAHQAHADRDTGHALFSLAEHGSSKARREACDRLGRAVSAFGSGRTRALVRSRVRLAIMLDAEGNNIEAKSAARQAMVDGRPLRSARVAADLARIRPIAF
jgi:transcriptional regulator with XRE-family HTH domain